MHRIDETLFWYWISERHKIYMKRFLGYAKPWTDDPILQSYKFCNVFRTLDTGTRWLVDNFLIAHYKEHGLLLGNIVWYRMINRISTAELLGWQKDWDTNEIISELQSINGPVFTSAYLIRSEQGMSKIESIVKAIEVVWSDRDQLAREMKAKNSLEVAHKLLLKYRLIGDFLAYEMVTDLSYTEMLRDTIDENTWCNIGPGALRGLRRLYGELVSKEDGVRLAVELLEKSKSVLDKSVPSLGIRDIEHSLCEVDKMARVKFSEGRPRQRYDGSQ